MDYEVVIRGVLPGFKDADVKAAFADLFSLSAGKVDGIFAAENKVLKTGISETLGQKYIVKLSEIGVYADLVPVSDVAEEPVPSQTASDSYSAAGGGAGESMQSTDATAESNYESRTAPFVFSGNGFEYFKIWIVNVLLSIVTLGIYSAWAKVRNKQYFYGNTTLDGASFSYTADPKKILLGRIISTVFLVVYSFSGQFSMVLSLIMGLLLLAFMPWIVCRSLHFNARYSSYRNVPFAFNGKLKEAFMAFVLWPIWGILSFGILMPMAYYKQQNFMLNNHAYGTAPFNFSATVGAYYKVFLITLGILIAGGALSALALTQGSMVLAGLFYTVAYLFFFAYFIVGVSNLRYNNLALQDHTFEASWELKSYTLLLLTNTIGIVLTLGLFIPWAKVRTAHYKAEHLQCVLDGDIDNFIAVETENVNALGESVGDIFDIDIGF